jgi:hypothetical protein
MLGKFYDVEARLATGRAVRLHGPGLANTHQARLEWKLKQLYDDFTWATTDPEAPWTRLPWEMVGSLQDWSRLEWRVR